MNDSRSNIFDAFNARFLEPEKVGSTFVVSPFFRRVLRSENTAVLGPRGSGKTTLLKMLTLPALNRWDDGLKAAAGSALDYVAVYIPASITWSAEYRSFADNMMTKDVSDLISVSLFRHSVLHAHISTLSSMLSPSIAEDPVLSRFSLEADGRSEALLTRSLADAWELKPATSSLFGLREALSARVRLLQRVAVQAAVDRAITAASLLDSHSFLSAHFIDDATDLRELLASQYGFGHKIALCFDELEIAAEVIASAVLRAPRSIDQNLLVKFSAAPYVGRSVAQGDPSIPTQQNDFDLVFLSSFSARETRGFSDALFASLCRKHGVSGSSEHVLGRSFLDEPHPGRGSRAGDTEAAPSRYGAQGSYQRKFKRLATLDPTFRVYADRKGIDLNDLSLGSENRRAAAVRKIIWPVLVREEFLFGQEEVPEEASQRRRLRTKNAVSDIYTGAGALFAICEGNPRWLLGLLEPMLQAYSADLEAGLERPVRRSLQKSLIERMTAAYFALLSTIPNSSEDRWISSLVDLVDRVGEYFKDSVLGGDFNPDPVMSFTVDIRTPPKLRDLVGRGLNIGAFVSTQDVSEDGGYRVGDISGLKVRLANIFAHRYKLPLAGGRTVNLSTILARRGEFLASTLSDLFGVKI